MNEGRTRRPVLSHTVVYGDGRSVRRLRVFCGRLGQSMDLDACARCAAFLEVNEEGSPEVICRTDGPGPMGGDERVEGAAYRVGALAVQAPLCVRDDVTTRDARALFRSHRPPFLLVVDAFDHVVGVVFPASLARVDVEALTVRDVMTTAGAAEETLSVDDALFAMAHTHRRALVIVDGEGTPVGSLRDVDALRMWTSRRRARGSRQGP